MSSKTKSNRKDFLKNLASYTGAMVLLPTVTQCKWQKKDGLLAVPFKKPSEWDSVWFNKTRGNQGAIPKTYLKDINGPDGVKKHIGKHLPYVPQIGPLKIPQGYLPIMWGDPSKGYAKHPNAPKDDSKNYEGHWYNWIRIRRSSNMGNEDELQSNYSSWPNRGEYDNGDYIALNGKDITKDSGKNTIYLVALPKDVKKGDTIRIHAHCKTHGEWVDFLNV